MTEFFFAKLNDDGTYGEPIKAEIIDFDNVVTGISDKPRDHRISWISGDEVSIECELDYKQMKEFVWAVILNLKRSEKRLVSKNLVKGGEEK